MRLFTHFVSLTLQKLTDQSAKSFVPSDVHWQGSDVHAVLLGADFIKSATLGFFLNIIGMLLSRFADQGLFVFVPGEPHMNHMHV